MILLSIAAIASSTHLRLLHYLLHQCSFSHHHLSELISSLMGDYMPKRLVHASAATSSPL